MLGTLAQDGTACDQMQARAFLEPLPPLQGLVDAWLEAEAVLAGDELAGSWAPGTAAREADDRRTPPTLPAPDASFDGEESGIETNETLTSAGPIERAPLSSRQERKSVVVQHSGATVVRHSTSLARFVAAITRVDDAYDVLEQRLQRKMAIVMADCWSAAAMLRLDALRTRLSATRKRRSSARSCAIGDQKATRFRCTSCTDWHYGPLATCNSRFCPRCVRKLRRENMARINSVLQRVEHKRQSSCRPVPRWRFLTLTAPSWSEFAPMRQLLGRAWGRFQHRGIWGSVKGALAVWETTHTTAGWHVHTHAAIDAYLPFKTLVRAWQQSVLQELVCAILRGDELPGVPCSDLVDRLRADEVARRHVHAVASRLCRYAERECLELRAAIESAPNAITDVRATKYGRTTVSYRNDLRQLLAAVPHPAGQFIKDFRGDTRSRVLSELAKYCGKDLGGAQVDDPGDYGIAGTPERLADFISGAWRWRCLRTYGECYDRDARNERQPMECQTCGGPMEFEGARWLNRAGVAALEREQAAKRSERRSARRALDPNRRRL